MERGIIFVALTYLSMRHYLYCRLFIQAKNYLVPHLSAQRCYMYFVTYVFMRTKPYFSIESDINIIYPVTSLFNERNIKHLLQSQINEAFSFVHKFRSISSIICPTTCLSKKTLYYLRLLISTQQKLSIIYIVQIRANIKTHCCGLSNV